MPRRDSCRRSTRRLLSRARTRKSSVGWRGRRAHSPRNWPASTDMNSNSRLISPPWRWSAGYAWANATRLRRCWRPTSMACKTALRDHRSLRSQRICCSSSTRAEHVTIARRRSSCARRPAVLQITANFASSCRYTVAGAIRCSWTCRSWPWRARSPESAATSTWPHATLRSCNRSCSGRTVSIDIRRRQTPRGGAAMRSRRSGWR